MREMSRLCEGVVREMCDEYLREGSVLARWWFINLRKLRCNSVVPIIMREMIINICVLSAQLLPHNTTHPRPSWLLCL